MEYCMHDWVLVNIIVEWNKGRVILNIDRYRYKTSEQVVANNFSKLEVPRRYEWGESETINEITGPIQLDSGQYRFSIEMQSGDVIEIDAESLDMPDSALLTNFNVSP